MIRRTHLAIGLLAGLYFLPFINYKVTFLITIILASLLPDVDHGMSALGKKSFFKPIQMMTSHRGILHTYTFCILITVIFSLFYPIIALPFFLGYSLHLFADSFTPQGIKPFWPLKAVSKGIVRAGGRIDTSIFMVFAILDIILLIVTIMQIFN